MRLIRLGERDIVKLLAGEGARVASGLTRVPSAVTLGSFDGLHLGHQVLIRAVLEARERLRLGMTGLFTFRHHPRDLLDPARAPRLLTPWGEKLALLAATGIDVVVAADFCPPLQHTPYDQFVQRFLIDLLAMRHFAAGHDVHLGEGRGGNAETLAALGRRLGYEFEMIPALEVGGHTVSSSVLRNLITGGEVAGARALLGRPYAVWGEVGPGHARGRAIGYPTANLTPLEPHKLLPGPGVYAIRALVPEEAVGDAASGAPAGIAEPPIAPEPVREISPALDANDDLRDPEPRAWLRHGGMLNFGRAPTFGGDEALRIEAHLFDFTGDLRGRTLKVEWLQRLREERKFGGVDELVAQLHRDEEEARQVCRAG